MELVVQEVANHVPIDNFHSIAGVALNPHIMPPNRKVVRSDCDSYALKSAASADHLPSDLE